jgi:hypothetical protein
MISSSDVLSSANSLLSILLLCLLLMVVVSLLSVPMSRSLVVVVIVVVVLLLPLLLVLVLVFVVVVVAVVVVVVIFLLVLVAVIVLVAVVVVQWPLLVSSDVSGSYYGAIPRRYSAYCAFESAPACNSFGLRCCTSTCLHLAVVTWVGETISH